MGPDCAVIVDSGGMGSCDTTSVVQSLMCLLYSNVRSQGHESAGCPVTSWNVRGMG